MSPSSPSASDVAGSASDPNPATPPDVEFGHQNLPNMSLSVPAKAVLDVSQAGDREPDRHRHPQLGARRFA